MYKGKVTPGTWSHAEDGTTLLLMWDLDNHPGKNTKSPPTPTWPRVLALAGHLEDDLGLQAPIEKSGSPDSFHVWVKILPTDPVLAHRFANAVLSEMKRIRPDMDWAIEAFPKQATKEAKSGSNVKLPGSINRRTGVRSRFVDRNRQPIDVLYIDRVAELRMPEEEAVKIGKNSYLPVNEVVRYTPRKRSGGMRPCIVAAMAKQLHGIPGSHDMRIAMVREKLANGGSKDDCIDMFRNQEDFDLGKTEYQVNNLISTGHIRPWKCSTIHEKCSNFVDCDNCPLAPVVEFPVGEEGSTRK
jgi:hypothetical protein